MRTVELKDERGLVGKIAILWLVFLAERVRLEETDGFGHRALVLRDDADRGERGHFHDRD